jgi:hypothetical protein
MTRGQFKPGKSANPGGRPKAQADAARKLALYIQQETDEGRLLADFALAILLVDSNPQPGRPLAEESARRRKLAEWGIKPEDVTLLDRRWAQEWLGERGLGKALQFIDVTNDDEAGAELVPIDLSGLTLGELKDLRRRLKAGDAAEDSPAADDAGDEGDEPDPPPPAPAAPPG